LGHGLCNNVARTVTLKSLMDDSSIILKECCQLLASIDVPACDLRGLGIQVSKLNNEDPSLNAYSNRLMNFLQKRTPKLGIPVSKLNNEDPSLDASSNNLMNFLQNRTPKRTVVPNGIFNQDPVSKVREIYAEVCAPTLSNKVGAQTFLSKEMTDLEIKELLNEWVSLHNDPANDDIEIIAEFLTSFIDGCDLERLQYILRMVVRIFENTCELSWIAAKEKIHECVQKKMKQVYGGILKIN